MFCAVIGLICVKSFAPGLCYVGGAIITLSEICGNGVYNICAIVVGNDCCCVGRRLLDVLYANKHKLFSCGAHLCYRNYFNSAMNYPILKSNVTKYCKRALVYVHICGIPPAINVFTAIWCVRYGYILALRCAWFLWRWYKSGSYDKKTSFNFELVVIVLLCLFGTVLALINVTPLALAERHFFLASFVFQISAK